MRQCERTRQRPRIVIPATRRLMAWPQIRSTCRRWLLKRPSTWIPLTSKVSRRSLTSKFYTESASRNDHFVVTKRARVMLRRSRLRWLKELREDQVISCYHLTLSVFRAAIPMAMETTSQIWWRPLKWHAYHTNPLKSSLTRSHLTEAASLRRKATCSDWPLSTCSTLTLIKWSKTCSVPPTLAQSKTWTQSSLPCMRRIRYLTQWLKSQEMISQMIILSLLIRMTGKPR